MQKRLKIIFAIATALLVCSCDDLRDSYDDCGIWLEFVFDHNMEYTDSFEEQVGSVDVLVFDAQGKLVLIKAADTEELEGRKRMFLGDSLPMGNYTVVTVGGLSEHFRFSHHDGSGFTRGETTMEDVRLALHKEEEAEIVLHEFPHLWYGRPVEIDYRADLSVWQIPLIRQTNKFNITLRHTITTTRGDSHTRATGDPVYIAEIVAPEAGVYDHWNDPIVRTPLTYRAYDYEALMTPITTGGTRHDNVSRMNTMRLLVSEAQDYQLVVRNTDTDKEVQSYNLLELLAGSKPGTRADNEAPLSIQEYLDRESDWNIVIIHNAPSTEGFIATQILVNGWIVWETEGEIG